MGGAVECSAAATLLAREGEEVWFVRCYVLMVMGSDPCRDGAQICYPVSTEAV
ncbi:unnamed protein product, partial [Musa acuminata subsp. burmannicoides]